MNDNELAEIAKRYIEKWYSSEQMWYWDDLYHATDIEEDKAFELYEECKEIWTKSFSEKYWV